MSILSWSLFIAFKSINWSILGKKYENKRWIKIVLRQKQSTQIQLILVILNNISELHCKWTIICPRVFVKFSGPQLIESNNSQSLRLNWVIWLNWLENYFPITINWNQITNVIDYFIIEQNKMYLFEKVRFTNWKIIVFIL